MKGGSRDAGLLAKALQRGGENMGQAGAEIPR